MKISQVIMMPNESLIGHQIKKSICTLCESSGFSRIFA
ncbi:hypothetical protein CHCC20327_1532 [Bacillus licheniformis]|nr:hypothetical protein CHCC20327_1532 [Bacillus licheniformis]